MKYREKDTNIYKTLSQNSKKEIKLNFRDKSGVTVGERTIQRWLNDPPTCPTVYRKLLKTCLLNIINDELTRVGLTIAVMTKVINGHRKQKKQLTEYLKNNSYESKNNCT